MFNLQSWKGLALLSRSSHEFDKHDSVENRGLKTRITLCLRFSKPLEEEKSWRWKTSNMFDGGSCTVLIKISDCLYEAQNLWPLEAALWRCCLVLSQAYPCSLSRQREHFWCLQKRSKPSHISAFGSPPPLTACQSREEGQQGFIFVVV